MTNLILHIASLAFITLYLTAADVNKNPLSLVFLSAFPFLLGACLAAEIYLQVRP